MASFRLWFVFLSWAVAQQFQRLNTKLVANEYPPMNSLVRDLSDGVRLIQLMVYILVGLALRYLRRYLGDHG